MITIEQVRSMIETLRDQGFVSADDDEELETVTELAFSLLQE